jgi:hypothetical protein
MNRQKRRSIQLLCGKMPLSQKLGDDAGHLAHGDQRAGSRSHRVFDAVMDLELDE